MTFDQYFYDPIGIKQFTIKLEIYIYDVERKDFIPAKDSKLNPYTESCLFIESDKVDLGSSLNYSRTQEIGRTLSLVIRNNSLNDTTLTALNN